MQILKMDFQSQSTPPVVPVMQSDAQSRFIGIALYDGGAPYAAPENAAYTVQYHGPGPNNMGWYDTISTGNNTHPAVTVDASNKHIVTLELAEQALRVNGNVFINLCVVTSTGYMLHTFPILCRVTGAAYVDPVAVRSFFYVTGITSEQWLAYVTACQDAQKRAEDAAATFETDPTLSLSGKAADAAKVGTALAEETTRAKASEEENAKGVSQLKEDIDNTRKEYQGVNVANPKEFVFGSYYNSGSLTEGDVYAHTGFIKVNEGDVIRFKDLSPYFNDYLRYDTFKADKTPTEKFAKLATKNAENLVEFTIQSGKEIAYIVINFGKAFADSLMVTINNAYPSKFIPYLHELLLNTNKLNLNFNILCTGDSICAGAGYDGGYAKILKQKYPHSNLTNYGVSGTTISPLHENSILSRLDGMSNEADIVILEGGVNDGFLGVPLGEFSMTEDSESKTYDTNTFCGAVETLFKNAHTKWKNAYIMFLIPMVSQITQTNAYLEKAKEICKKWGVTPIDIRESGMCVYSTELKDMYTNNGSGTGDGLHPNELGYNKFYLPMIESAIYKFFN